MKVIILSFFLCSSVFADSAVALQKGQIVPFDGILITKEKSKELRQIEKDNGVLKKQKTTLQELGKVLELQREVWKESSNENFKQYKKEQFKGNLRGIWGFLVGVGITSFGYIIAKETIKRVD